MWPSSGKPNVGKSSLINKLLGENRLIVSDIAGTTRDAVDTEITYNGKEYVFIDTAGLRRKNKIKEELERYMIVRTVSAVERAEVVVLMIDAEEGVTEQDAKIAGIAHERGKATIIVVNKWDAIEKDDKTIYKFTEKVRNTLILHALCRASVRLCENRTETAQAVRDDRHRQ
ncbi:MAG: GTPase [Waltera sp.]